MFNILRSQQMKIKSSFHLTLVIMAITKKINNTAHRRSGKERPFYNADGCMNERVHHSNHAGRDINNQSKIFLTPPANHQVHA